MKSIYAGILSASLIAAASAQADPVQVKFAYPSAPNNALFAQGAQGWADDVNKAAEGAIEIRSSRVASSATIPTCMTASRAA